MTTVVVPACRGEFGLKIRYHVPAVHHMATRERVVVMHEPGEEALYPAAHQRVLVPRMPADGDRRGTWPRGDRETVRTWATAVAGPDDRVVFTVPGTDPEERFRPVPHHTLYMAHADVVLCPRFRRYGAAKNWFGWTELDRTLGIPFVAAGVRETSYDMPHAVEHTWRFSRVLDATIEAMRRSRVVVATDAGLAHLAVLCDVPHLILVTYRGLVAPGPVVDADGRVMAAKYWPVRVRKYYRDAVHGRCTIDTVDGWENPAAVRDAIERILDTT